MTAALCAIFFVSGAAALLFETLWFRQAGLAFGNSVWASSLVLSSFMAGLALGNGLAARFGATVARPVRLYAGLEVLIAASGLALVQGLPQLGGALAALMRGFLDDPWILNPLRLGIGFLLLGVPATAMGATLPVLVRALVAHDPSFGSALGRLYGWNTLGAVLGAVAGETWLVAWLGVRGTGLFAAGCSGAAGGVALALSRRLARAREAPPAAATASLGGVGLACLAATFLAGGILLAFEVVWFRFLHLFVHPGSLSFAWMLSVVLAGIGLGGFAGGAWLRRDALAHRHAAPLAFASGAVAVALYHGFGAAVRPFRAHLVAAPHDVVWLAFALCFPVAWLSGLLFPLVGAALHARIGAEARAAGLITLANTAGAALGSLAAGFVLLPRLGMERSFACLAAGYGAVALLLLASRPARVPGRRTWLSPASALCFAAGLALFPFGRMERSYLRIPVERQTAGRPERVVAVREGRSETAVYLRRDFLGEPLSYRLLTDGFSMSGTSVSARRYMKLYAWWPVALRPDPKRALLISYGVGSTARALVDTRSLERIDVVDVSREILELSDIVYPDPKESPLRDPRVRVHVEDGRYFLQVTQERYDLITGEPPPPKNAGVVNLYTREYFELIRRRLTQGGTVTYWLPMHNLLEGDAKSIIRAFCDVFADCTLWTGTSLDWMLVGSRGATGAPDERAFSRQWREPRPAAELRATGIERPEQLGALFLADATHLRAYTRDAEPLTDDFPKRLSPEHQSRTGARAIFGRWMEVEGARERFRGSEFVRRTWPDAMRRRTLAYFEFQALINQVLGPGKPGGPAALRDLHRVLTGSALRTLPLWLLGSDADQVRIARTLAGSAGAETAPPVVLAYGALAERRFAEAAAWLHRARAREPDDGALHYLEAYADCLAGRRETARELLAGSTGTPALRAWLRDTCGLGGSAARSQAGASASASATSSSSRPSPPSQKAGSVTSTPSGASRTAGSSEPPARSSSR